mmetsp:Transcript_13525/g.36131  ORF Transcript_13525/g.36131 Transcript_13525/m.36131 type:complete len:232 (+) Transcript_13525:403-1098(+)
MPRQLRVRGALHDVARAHGVYHRGADAAREGDGDDHGSDNAHINGGRAHRPATRRRHFEDPVEAQLGDDHVRHLRVLEHHARVHAGRVREDAVRVGQGRVRCDRAQSVRQAVRARGRGAVGGEAREARGVEELVHAREHGGEAPEVGAPPLLVPGPREGAPLLGKLWRGAINLMRLTRKPRSPRLQEERLRCKVSVHGVPREQAHAPLVQPERTDHHGQLIGVRLDGRERP